MRGWFWANALAPRVLLKVCLKYRASTGRFIAAYLDRFMLKSFLALLLTLAFVLPATGQSAGSHDFYQRVARRDQDRGGGMSLNQAVQQVQSETGGRVLSAETINQGGRSVHRIKVLTPSGQVRVMTIDARGR